MATHYSNLDFSFGTLGSFSFGFGSAGGFVVVYGVVGVGVVVVVAAASAKAYLFWSLYSNVLLRTTASKRKVIKMVFIIYLN